MVNTASHDRPLNEYHIYFCKYRNCSTRFARAIISKTQGVYTHRQSSATWTKRIGDGLTAPFAANSLETKTQIPKYHSKGGHGFAAEDANNLADRLRGRKARVVGTSNDLNGPDRIVNGVKVQSKYCQTASETVRSAFDPTSGKYRYSGQVLEVPKDQYKECLKQMRDRIRRGNVPGITNPSEAENLVKQGTVTYKQARNIARAGNIDSLIFDAKTQSATSVASFGISFVIAYAQARVQGKSNREAMKAALHSALASGGATLVTGIIGAQLLRTRAAAIGVASVRGGVRAASRTPLGRAAVHRIAAGSLGKGGVYGAAAVNHVSKLLRSNAVTGTVVTVVTCTPDFYRAAFARSISWQQFIKNTAVNVVSVAGGIGGWMAGAAAGAAIGSVMPGPGTAIGGFVGGALGAIGVGLGAGKVVKTVADGVVEDDSKRLLKILEDELQTLAFEYMLTEGEVEQIVGVVRKTGDEKWLRRMYKKTRNSDYSCRRFVRREFEQEFQRIIRKRPKFTLPSIKEFEEEVCNLVEKLEDVIEDAPVTLRDHAEACTGSCSASRR